MRDQGFSAAKRVHVLSRGDYVSRVADNHEGLTVVRRVGDLVRRALGNDGGFLRPVDLVAA